jgi:hypothetical protein
MLYAPLPTPLFSLFDLHCPYPFFHHSTIPLFQSFSPSFHYSTIPLFQSFSPSFHYSTIPLFQSFSPSFHHSTIPLFLLFQPSPLHPPPVTLQLALCIAVRPSALAPCALMDLVRHFTLHFSICTTALPHPSTIPSFQPFRPYTLPDQRTVTTADPPPELVTVTLAGFLAIPRNVPL